MHGEKIFTCHFCATLQTGDPGWFSAVFSMFSAAVFSWGCSHRDICQKRLIESVLKVKEINLMSGPREWKTRPSGDLYLIFLLRLVVWLQGGGNWLLPNISFAEQQLHICVELGVVSQSWIRQHGAKEVPSKTCYQPSQQRTASQEGRGCCLSWRRTMLGWVVHKARYGFSLPLEPFPYQN